MKNIKEIKNDIGNIFIYSKRGEEHITIFNMELEKKYPKLVSLFYKNGFEVEDFYYDVGMEAIEAISYAIEESEDLEDIKRAIENEEFDYIEADIYTSNLTKWLNESVNNVAYITEAQEQMGEITDGFQLLQTAQYVAKMEICNVVKNAVLDLLQDLET